MPAGNLTSSLEKQLSGCLPTFSLGQGIFVPPDFEPRNKIQSVVGKGVMGRQHQQEYSARRIPLPDAAPLLQAPATGKSGLDGEHSSPEGEPRTNATPGTGPGRILSLLLETSCYPFILIQSKQGPTAFWSLCLWSGV